MGITLPLSGPLSGPPSAPLVRRLGTVVVTAALAASGLSLVAAPAQAAADPRPATIGGDWLAGQLTDGLAPSPYGRPDPGLSIDTAMALDAVGGHASDISAISDALGPLLVTTGSDQFGYAESNEYTWDPNGGPGTLIQKGYYASGLAKSLYFAETAGAPYVGTIATWAGADLQADLEGLVTASGPSKGRLVDDSSYGDYASTLSQAYAAAALTDAGSAKAADVLAFLLQQQCNAGYFRLSFTTPYDAADQSCNGGRSSGDSPADPDVTAEVARLLLPIAATDPVVARRVGKAEAWLLGQQHADGSYSGGTSTDVPNANSTGLAGWVLMELGDDQAAARAAGWVRQHQADETAGCSNGLSSETGAIGYDDTGVAAAVRDGIGSARATWVRAASQALPVLAVAPEVTAAVHLAGPTGYARAGSAATYRITGAVPGEKLCLTGGRTPVRVAADAEGTARGTLTLPAGTGTRTITATERDGATDVTTTKALGATRLRVKAAHTRVRRAHKVLVRVSGLAAGEHVVLRVRGKVVRTGTASAAGTFVRRVPVHRKLGRAKVRATGQFPAIRSGATHVRVVR